VVPIIYPKAKRTARQAGGIHSKTAYSIRLKKSRWLAQRILRFANTQSLAPQRTNPAGLSSGSFGFQLQKH
jgi:hypothetical protein